MIRTLLASALCCACALPARADQAARCVDISVPRGAIEGRGGRWVEVTELQRAFLAGVFVLNPNTPAGLPFGDRAALARVDGDKGGLVFWLDAERACTPMPIPDELIEMLQHIGQGDVTHEGQAN